MPNPKYQTIRLSAGKHSSPESGACVMELASMLAGERFSDRPQSVSRTIAAFLRSYNDRLDDNRRQDLYEYAAKVVGTVSAPAIESARAARLVQWADERRRRRRWSTLGRFQRESGSGRRVIDPESAACYAIRAMGRVQDETHAAVLEIIDELIEFGAAHAYLLARMPVMDAISWPLQSPATGEPPETGPRPPPNASPSGCMVADACSGWRGQLPCWRACSCP